MPDIPGTNIKDPIRPYHTDCTYPTALADEIAGGLKYVATEAGLTGPAFTPERRPIGTVAGIGIGKFKQWTGSIWVPILQGFDPPTALHSASNVLLRFDTMDVAIKAATATASGVMTPALYSRLLGHGAKHLHDGDDPIAALTATPGRIPQADSHGRISQTWFPFATKTIPGTVRVADDGEAEPDVPGEAIAVVRANDSRLTRFATILEKLEALSFPIHYVETLPPKAVASPQAFYWLKPAETLYLLISNTWIAIAGKEVTGQAGKSAYEIAVDQGYSGSIGEWLAGLIGADGLSAYEVAVERGYPGTPEEWLASLKGADGKSNYEIAQGQGFTGTVTEWLESIKGEPGDKGEPGRSLVILGYYPTYQAFENAGLSPDKGDLYCVEGDLYLWSGVEWIDLGPLFKASVFEFEFELWANQPGNSNKTLEDFLREVITDAVSGEALEKAIRQEVNLWLQDNLGNLFEFEFEILANHLESSNKTFEDFLRDAMIHAISGEAWENIIRQEVRTWLRDNLGNLFEFEFEVLTNQPENSHFTFVDFMQELIRQEVAAWLEQNLESI